MTLLSHNIIYFNVYIYIYIDKWNGADQFSLSASFKGTSNSDYTL